ncbi:MAG: PH domain-containing protein [Pirellulales bacterium]
MQQAVGDEAPAAAVVVGRKVVAKQAIPGVAPAELGEVTIMTVWPTIAATATGRFLGRLYGNRSGLGHMLTVGKLSMLLTIPIALGLFFAGLLPGICRRYRLTNRRLIIAKGLRALEERSITLDEFDEIDVQILPGQAWYPAGELIFRKGPVETFRLSGVSRPETFRQTCLKAQRAHAGVQRAVAHRPG